MQRVASLFLVVFLTVAWSGCRDSAYAAAAKRDTIASLREFLDAHPLDENAESARGRLLELELDEARRVHTVVAYKRFLEVHPEGEQARTARALLEGLRFNATAQRDTALAWRQFVKDHPDGAHRADADERLARAELAEVPRLDDAAEL